jgi:hypothetical protein
VLRVTLSLTLCALALCLCTTARAESLGMLRLPPNIAQLPDESPIDILNPTVASSAWAIPGHHPLGITLNNYDLTQQQIEAVRQTGCGLVRLYIPMEKFLTAEDADWATLDQVISRLRRADLEVVAVLDAASPVGEAFQRQFFREFCDNVATRYCASLRYYQLLDDINYKLGLSSRAYADLLAVCKPQLKAADKDAVIVAGGIRGCDLTFLDMLETQYALRNIDVIALSLMPQADGIEAVSKLARADHSLPYVGDVVTWAQARGKKVWVTSFGVSTDSSWVGVDQVTQGCMYARGALILGTLGVEHIIYAQVQDNDPTYQIPARCCGLLDVDGQPKASYYMLTSLAGVVTGAYHALVPFNCSGQTYQRPAEADIHSARQEQIEASRRIFTGQAYLEEAYATANPLDTFRTNGVEVFSYWFYAPATQEYRLIYWLTHEQTYPSLITLVCENARLLPFAEHLAPQSAFQMLSGSREQPEFAAAKNMVILYYLGLDTIPSVVSFKASANRKPQRAEQHPALQTPAFSNQQPNPDVASFRR